MPYVTPISNENGFHAPTPAYVLPTQGRVSLWGTLLCKTRMKAVETPRVLIISDNLLDRAGLAALLADFPGCEVAGQAGSAAMSTQIDLLEPDVLLYDLGWVSPADPRGLPEAAESGLPLVVLLPNEEAARAALPLLRGGAFALLLHDSTPETVVAALQAAAAGLLVLDPVLAALLTPSATPAEGPAETLTPREQEVLLLLAQGLTNRAIAHRLAITEHTVKFHVNAIMGKLDAQSRTEAVVQATRLGLIAL